MMKHKSVEVGFLSVNRAHSLAVGGGGHLSELFYGTISGESNLSSENN